MKKIVYVLVRYSLLYSKPPKSFHLSSGVSSLESYKARLFDKERLRKREYFFENITLASLDGVYAEKPDDVFFKVLLITSEELPSENKSFLEKKEAAYPWLEVFYQSHLSVDINKLVVDSAKADIEAEGSDCAIVATCRLDDDDALFRSYLTALSQYLVPEFLGSIISFPSGYSIYIDSDSFKILGVHETYKEKIALGLCYISKYSLRGSDNSSFNHIYNAGNHVKVDGKYNVIYDSSSPAFVRVNSDTSDRMYLLDSGKRASRVLTEIKNKKASLNEAGNELMNKLHTHFDINL